MIISVITVKFQLNFFVRWRWMWPWTSYFSEFARGLLLTGLLFTKWAGSARRALKVHIIGQIGRVHKQILQRIHHGLEHVLPVTSVRRAERRGIIGRGRRGWSRRGRRAGRVRRGRDGRARRVRCELIGVRGGDGDGRALCTGLRWLHFRTVIEIRVVFVFARHHLVPCGWFCGYFERGRQSRDFLARQRAIIAVVIIVHYTVRAVAQLGRRSDWGGTSRSRHVQWTVQTPNHVAVAANHLILHVLRVLLNIFERHDPRGLIDERVVDRGLAVDEGSFARVRVRDGDVEAHSLARIDVILAARLDADVQLGSDLIRVVLEVDRGRQTLLQLGHVCMERVSLYRNNKVIIIVRLLFGNKERKKCKKK